MRYVIFICLIVFWSPSLFAEERAAVMDSSDMWITRSNPSMPVSDEEELAVKAAAERGLLKQNKTTAIYDGHKESYEIVTLETATESTEDLYVVVRYQVRGNQICGETKPVYTIRQKPESEKIAYEAALYIYKGGDSYGPVIINDKVFNVNYNGKCHATVSEIKDDVQQFTYKFNMCK